MGRAEMVPLVLGSGRVADCGVGSKAANLDRAARAGIAVAAGFVVAHLQPVDIGVRDLSPVAGGPVAVRSAFSAEDSSATAMAGFFDTILDVPCETKYINILLN